MKKIVIVIVILLLLAGGGAAVYHFFFQTEDQPLVEDKPDTAKTDTDENSPAPMPVKPKEPVNDLFVNQRQVTVFNQPDEQGFKVKTLYKGDAIKVQERKNGYLRISDYVVLKQGQATQAQWVKQEEVSEKKPVIDQQERNEILDSYVAKSDDYLLYRDVFRRQTEQLLQEKRCTPEDFEQLGGWVRSVTYAEQPIYFVYCGGLNQIDKIYLNVESGEVFQPNAN